MSEGKFWLSMVGMIIGAFMLVVVGCLVGCPQYNVYSSRLSGAAKLAEAQSSRQIKIQEANATFESARKLAAADTLRAWGVRRSNEIIQDGLGGPKGYLEYLYIEAITHSGNQFIYLPTEAGMPVLEAGRMNRGVEK